MSPGKTKFPAVEASLGAARRYSPTGAQVAKFRAMFLSAVFKNPQKRLFSVFGACFPPKINRLSEKI